MQHFLRKLMFLLSFIVVSSSSFAHSVTLEELKQGGVFTIKNAVTNAYVYDTPGSQLHLRSTTDNSDDALWYIKFIDNSFRIINVKTSRTPKKEPTGGAGFGSHYSVTNHYIRNSQTNGRFVVSGDNGFANGKCWRHSNDQNFVSAGNANANTSTSSTDWIIERHTESIDEVNARFLTTHQYTTEPEEGKYYRIVSAGYLDFCLDIDRANNTVSNVRQKKGALTQLWKITKQGNQWSFQNAVSEQYIQKTAQQRDPFSLGEAASFFAKSQETDWMPLFTFQGTHIGLHGTNTHAKGWFRWAWASKWLFAPVEVTAQELLVAQAEYNKMKVLRTGAVVSIKNAVSGKYVYEDENSNLRVRTDLGNDDRGLWYIKYQNGAYRIYNAFSGRTPFNEIGERAPVSTNPHYANYYIKKSSYSQAFTISWDAKFANSKCWQQKENSDSIMRGVANANVTASYSDFLINIASESKSEIDKRFRERHDYTLEPEEGEYYRIVSVGHLDRCLEIESSKITTPYINDNAYSQLWLVEKDGNRWAFKNALAERYINSSFARNEHVGISSEKKTFAKSEDGTFFPLFTFQGDQIGLHGTTHHAVGWSTDAWASNWLFKKVARPDAEDFERAKKEFLELTHLQNDGAELNPKLQIFFEDYACTVLRADYANVTDEALRQAMTQQQLPLPLIEVALRVKNDRWRENELENEMEKKFRIAKYMAHSDPVKWAQDRRLMRTTFRYSQLTNPTGITSDAVGKPELALIFVDEEPPAGTTLKVELVSGFNATGEQHTLHKGVNAVTVSNGKHLYIYYNIDNADMRLDQAPDIKIHIEGLRVNGCFDINRHTTQDWKKLRELREQEGSGFLQDEVIRMKSKWNCFSFHLTERDGVLRQEDKGEWIWNGEDKGITGILGLWDEISEMEMNFLSLDRYRDRFNCLMGVFSHVGTYAFNYGVYCGTVSSLFSYKHLKSGGNEYEGGNLWAIAHEIGHHFQDLFDIVGSTESSNNLFSNISVWNTGRNVRRGSPQIFLMNRYNTNKSWLDAGIGGRMHMYWQLWLYYVELGHKPTFFQELIDKFRQEPLNRRNARTDMFRFAKFCCDVAQEDLTEFFTLYGFFNRTGKRLPVSWGDPWYDKSYGLEYIDIDEADIRETLEYMAQFPKKRHNLFFMDERINKIPVTLPGVPENTFRWGTSGHATPGDPIEVGDVGHYTLFKKGQQKPAQPSHVQLIDRSVIVEGEYAVGYKVYDKTGKLRMVTNRNRFALPDDLPIEDAIVKVAGADGDDVEVIKDSEVLAEYKKEVFPPSPENNTANIHVSTTHGAPESPYTIYLAAAPSHAVGATTQRESLNNAGIFAFYQAEQPGEYYIYGVTANKWLTYSDVRPGANKVQLEKHYAHARPWKIVPENNPRKGYDIIPATGNDGWHWRTNANLGLYNVRDNHTGWILEPAQINDKLYDLIAEAKQMYEQNGTGYPLATASTRTAFLQAIQAAEANGGNIGRKYGNLQKALRRYWGTPESEFKPFEAGKAYRFRHFYANDLITNAPTLEGKNQRKISLSQQRDNSTIWIAQKDANGGLHFASALGTGYLVRTNNRGDLIDNQHSEKAYTSAKGSVFGSINLRTEAMYFSGSTEAHLAAVTNTHGADTHKPWGTDFFVEDVSDFTYDLTVTEGSNGNFATLHLPFAVVIPEGIKVHNVSIDGEHLRYAPLTITDAATGQQVLPAYTPVLVSATAPGVYQFSPTDYRAPQTTATGLRGTISALPNAQLDKNKVRYYVLTKENNRFLMRVVGLANIPANRAYFAISSAETEAQRLQFEASEVSTGVTSIDEKVVKDVSPTQTFDLSGRRVETLKDGEIYIQNGEKTMIF